MKRYYLCFKLISDAAFSRGDGLAGEVDSEIQYDDLGCPYLSGRTLKGILVNECADLLSALPVKQREYWEHSAERLFGKPGQLSDDGGLLRISDAHLPHDLRIALQADFNLRLNSLDKPDQKTFHYEKEVFRSEILQTLTDVRTQTAIDSDGVTREHSLRRIRVILRETPFEADLFYFGENEKEENDDMALLSACVAAFRRAGSHRNRGLGKLSARLLDENRVENKSIISPFIKGVEA